MIKSLSLIATILFLWLTPDYNTSKPKEKILTLKQQEKEYTVKGTIQDYQVLFSNQDDISKNLRDKTIQKFAAQINQQIISDTTKKK